MTSDIRAQLHDVPVYGEVLQERADAGYVRPDHAARLGRKILCENARKFFGDEELESQ